MHDRNSISDFKVGDKIEVERKLEISDLDRFIELSGDSSSIHLDKNAAAAFGFSGRVAHGMLVGSCVSAVIGTRLPGNCGVLQSINMDFRAPVIPPEVLKIVVEVLAISSSVGQLKLAVRVFRADGTLAVSGEARSIIKAKGENANL